MIGALLLIPALLLGGEPPHVAAGTVATIAVPLPAGGPATFSVEPAEGIRFVSPLAGSVAAGATSLPVTFSVNRGRAAGPLTVGTISLQGSSGAPRAVPIDVIIEAKQEVQMEALAERPTVAIGEDVSVRLLVRNAGNAPDTVEIGFDAEEGFSVPGLPMTLALEAGEERVEIVQVRASARLIAGPVRTVVFHARSRDVIRLEEVRLTVTDAPDMDRAYLPGSFFVGTGNGMEIGSGLPSFSANLAGDVVPGTRVTLAMRHSADEAFSAPLQPYMTGARFRASVTRGGWSLTGGEVALIGSVLTGHAAPGNGIQLRGGFDANFVSLTYAESRLNQGRTIGARIQRETGIGLLGLRVGTEPGLFGATQDNHVTLTFARGLAGAHQVEAEAGYISRGEVPALGTEATYRYRGVTNSAFARFRGVSSAQTAGTLPSSEVQLGGGLGLTHGFRAQASAQANGVYLGLGPADHGEAIGSAGLSWLGGGVQLTSSVTAGHYTDLFSSGTTRGIGGTATVPVGHWVGEASVQRSERALGPFTTAILGARRMSDRGWIQASSTWTMAPFAPPSLRSDASAEMEVRGLTLRGGAGADYIEGAVASPSGWGAVALPVFRRTELILGSEYRPWVVATSPWSISIGIQRRTLIPLPRRAAEKTRGIAFEDLNANGRHDPGEPGVSDLVLRAGGTLTTTTASGEFEMAASGERIEFEAPGRWFVQGPEVRASGGRILLPLVSPASLQLLVFDDVDGDGARTAAEPALAEVPVQLRDAEGRVRSLSSAADGSALFTGLRPGAYTVILLDRADAAGNRSQRETAVEVGNGESVQLELAGERQQREIRMSGVAARPGNSN